MQISETEVFRACRTLFGPDLQLNRDFLHYLQPSGVRIAFRKRAMQTHPDRFAVSGNQVREQQERLFQDLNQAHQTVQLFLKQRDRNPVSARFTSSQGSSYQQSQRSRHERPFYNRYYQGSVPSRPLQFGLFLYYQGIIPFSAMISALTWQRQQRPVLGDIARRWGWLNDDQIRQVLSRQSGPGRFGERAENLGLLSGLQVRALLLHQRTRQQQMGRFFVDQGYFDDEDLNQLLELLASHNQQFRQNFGGQFYYQHHPRSRG